jgi:rubrerythrin
MPVADLSEGRWQIWICSRCLKPERDFPADTRQQIEGMRKGTWPTAGMSRNRWPNTCHCGGVVREIEVMVKPNRWDCPGCGEDLGLPECPICEAAYAMDGQSDE